MTIKKTTHIVFHIFCFLLPMYMFGANQSGAQNMGGPVFQPGNANIQVSDFFGAAQLLEGILNAANSERFDQVFQDPGKLIKVTLLVGVIAAVVKVALSGTQKTIESVPSWGASLMVHCQHFFVHLFRLPQALPEAKIVMWEHIFENLMITLCEKSNQTDLMLRSMASESGAEQANGNWLHYREYVHSVFNQCMNVFASYRSYYDEKRALNRYMHVGRYELQNVSFLIHTISATLEHVIDLCKKTESFEALPKEYLKKLTRNTLILFKELAQAVSGKAYAASSGSSNNAGASQGLSNSPSLLSF